MMNRVGEAGPYGKGLTILPAQGAKLASGWLVDAPILSR